jgi:hypothetical protein
MVFSKSDFWGVRQFAVLQQVGDFEEVAVFSQLLDRVAAVQQLALVTVDIGDLGLAAGRGQEAGVIREEPVLPPRVRISITSLPCVPDMIGNSTDLPSMLSVAVRCVVMFGPFSLLKLQLPSGDLLRQPARSSSTISFQRSFSTGCCR